MIVTRKFINKLRQNLLLKISNEAEELILQKFGQQLEKKEDLDTEKYTEQQILEEIRKILDDTR